MVGMLVAAAMAAGGTSAVAGGPTSLLIVEPQTGRAVAEYLDDSAYAALDAVLAAPRSQTRQTSDGNYGLRGTGRMITLTWLVHDALIWRVNHVFPEAPGGPWVLTLSMDENGQLSDLGTWSRPADAARLVAVLDRALATDNKSRPEYGIGRSVGCRADNAGNGDADRVGRCRRCDASDRELGSRRNGDLRSDGRHPSDRKVGGRRTGDVRYDRGGSTGHDRRLRAVSRPDGPADRCGAGCFGRVGAARLGGRDGTVTSQPAGSGQSLTVPWSSAPAVLRTRSHTAWTSARVVGCAPTEMRTAQRPSSWNGVIIANPEV